MTMTTTQQTTDGPIHDWFGLTYSNYLVLPRSMMQSMPVAWQQQAVALFDRLDAAFPDLERAPKYIVQPATESTYSDLTPADMTLLGVTCPYSGDGLPEVYVDSDGCDHTPEDMVLVPLDVDPVPHYNRGRTYIEPTGL